MASKDGATGRTLGPMEQSVRRTMLCALGGDTALAIAICFALDFSPVPSRAAAAAQAFPNQRRPGTVLPTRPRRGRGSWAGSRRTRGPLLTLVSVARTNRRRGTPGSVSKPTRYSKLGGVASSESAVGNARLTGALTENPTIKQQSEPPLDQSLYTSLDIASSFSTESVSCKH